MSKSGSENLLNTPQPQMQIKPIQVIELEGPRIKGYVGILTRLIEGARLNKYFPDPSSLNNLLHFLVPENNQGFYNKLLINRETGMPIEKEISKIITDKQLSEKTLKSQSEECLQREYDENPVPVNERRLRRFRYHKDLAAKEIPQMFKIEMKLRSVDTEKYVAFFNVVLDRFDMSTSLFSRYTLVVGQKDPQWSKPNVILVGEELKYTKDFRYQLSRYTVDEAEFAFILLNDLKHVVVEEVQRCRIGPLYFRGVNIPKGMEEIFEKHPDTFILSLPTDRASIHIKEDRNDDPLSQMYRDALEPEARELRDIKARQTGYHVYKERKFVCTRNAIKDFREFLKRRGGRCVVYGI